MPRPLTDKEREFLFYVLPENKEIYRNYRKRIESMIVIGPGRFGEGNCVLGFSDDEPDLSYASMPVFAAGQLIYDNAVIQITIHEEYQNKIEFNISNLKGEKLPENMEPLKGWSYSFWNSGDSSPFENDKLREIDVGGLFRIVISESGKCIWIHEYDTKYNHIIPVSNFINELLRGNRKFDREKGINMNDVIDNNKVFSDEDFIRTLIQYNKQWRRLDISSIEEKKLPLKKKQSPSIYKKKNK